MSWDDDFANDRAMDGAETRGKKRTVTVGWTVRTKKAGLIWSAPAPFSRSDRKAPSAKSVQYCPAAIDFDRRHFVIPCPVDLTLRFERQPDGQLKLVDGQGEQSGMRGSGLRDLVMLHPPAEWRDPSRPIIQILAPYVFVSDDPCFVVQTSPYLHYSATPPPGVQMGGRYPVHLWPRPLSWGFEWWDISQPLVLKRGAPWFYVHFETENPAARVRLVEQEMTPELESFIDSILDVSNYVNKTFSLFSEAQRTRPQVLVKEKKN
ncbi:MAG: hypothetical protein AAGB02_03380 [Pseudomonadota bacterium]